MAKRAKEQKAKRSPAATRRAPAEEVVPRPWRARWVLELALFLSLAVFITWPLARHLTSRIPLGTERVATVPLFNLWTLWWNEDRLQHLYQGYWNAPIFHPSQGVFALSESQPLTGAAAAMLHAVTGSPVMAYNAVVLIALTLNGWAACRLLRGAGLGGTAELAGGAMVECLPFVQQELGVLQLIPLSGVLFTLHALVRLGDGPDVRNGFTLGLSFGATMLMCGYYALSLSVLIVLGGAWLVGRRLRDRGLWSALGVSLLVVVPLTFALVRPQLRIHEDQGFERSVATVNRFSAEWGHYRYTPWPQFVPTPGVEAANSPSARAFWPGTLKLVIAVVGMFLGIRQGPRRFTAFCATVLVSSLILSLGPDSGDVSLYGLLSSVFPGFAQLRSPFRFAVFFQMAVALLAAVGIGRLWAAMRERAVWQRALVLVVATGSAIEVLPTNVALAPVPSTEARPRWLEWVETRTRPDDVLVFLPFPEGRNSRDYLETTEWMFWQTRHGRPMVNGYSGFFPKPFLELKATLQGFPSDRSMEALAASGVRYCVILRGKYSPDIVRFATPHYRLRPTFSDESAQVDIYEIVDLRSGQNAGRG